MGRERGRESYELRSRHNRRRRRDVWIFTEGELTEPQYFDLVKDLQPERRNEVRIANDSRRSGGRRGRGDGGSGRKPKDLVAAAITLKHELDGQVDPDLPDDLKPVVWCVFDRDQHDGIDQAVARAAKAGVRVAFSHPCFELWRLLHHQAYTATLGGVCDRAADRLPFAAGQSAQQRKAVTLDQIRDGYPAARKRAEQMNAQHGEHVPPSQRDPYTDVWRLVEELGITSY